MTNPSRENTAVISAEEGRTCPRCGLSETRLRTEGLLGCAICYETFADLVAQAVEALHGVTVAPPSSPLADVTPETESEPRSVARPRRRETLSWLTRGSTRAKKNRPT